ncbi:MAG: SDR family NAD(P)-dependent oxidoreductase [Clostridia bacterium]|nr:SDR family NAD(P)-dependent oxidoreductase [Clostridia bacterium]
MAKTILITGASGAIGSMVAYKAALKKYNIVMCYHTGEQRCKKFAADLEKLGSKVLCLGGDITDEAERTSLVRSAIDTFGGIDVLINNAGTALYGLFQEQSDREIADIVHTDLTSQMLLSKEVLPYMLARHSGSIVNVSSMWGLVGAAGEVAYSAAKAGMIGFTKALAKEVAGGGVRVNAVAPGCVESRMTAHFTPEELEEICDGIPLGRFGDALEIAESILFMAEHGYTTGQVLSPNGGMVI